MFRSEPTCKKECAKIVTQDYLKISQWKCHQSNPLCLNRIMAYDHFSDPTLCRVDPTLSYISVMKAECSIKCLNTI